MNPTPSYFGTQNPTPPKRRPVTATRPARMGGAELAIRATSIPVQKATATSTVESQNLVRSRYQLTNQF